MKKIRKGSTKDSDEEISLYWVIWEGLSEMAACELCPECTNEVLRKERSRQSEKLMQKCWMGGSLMHIRTRQRASVGKEAAGSQKGRPRLDHILDHA